MSSATPTHPWVVFTKTLEHIETAEAGQPDVEEDEVRALVMSPPKRLLAIDGPNHGIPFAFEMFGYGVEDLDLVLPRWTSQIRPYVDRPKPAIGRAPKPGWVVARSFLKEQGA